MCTWKNATALLCFENKHLMYFCYNDADLQKEYLLKGVTVILCYCTLMLVKYYSLELRLLFGLDSGIKCKISDRRLRDDEVQVVLAEAACISVLHFFQTYLPVSQFITLHNSVLIFGSKREVFKICFVGHYLLEG